MVADFFVESPKVLRQNFYVRSTSHGQSGRGDVNEVVHAHNFSIIGSGTSSRVGLQFQTASRFPALQSVPVFTTGGSEYQQSAPEGFCTPGFNLYDPPSTRDPMNILAEGSALLAEWNAQSSQAHPPTRRQPIHQAAQAGNFGNVKYLLERAPHCAHALGPDNVTPLWCAPQGGFLNIVELLLNYKVDVQVSLPKSGRTPIHQAAQEGHFEVVKALLDQGAEPDSRDRDEISPLWSAAQLGHHKIVKLLLEKQASTERPPRMGIVDQSIRPHKMGMLKRFESCLKLKQKPIPKDMLLTIRLPPHSD
ncbi:ankyrin repeat-containing domain protein [Xylaria acuta]|nr:ankyrin repeat-containing domain protein [Xylaria acuta]